MDYKKWAEEYKDNSDRITCVINRLKEQKSRAKEQYEIDELSAKIRYYSFLRRDMESTADYLMKRAAETNKQKKN